MKKLLLIIPFLLVTLSTFAQKKGAIILTKKDGNTIELEVKYKIFKGEYFFPEDWNPMIEGEVNGEKIKIYKSELKKITQSNGKEYIVLRTNNGHVLGQFVTEGTIRIFKLYSNGRRSSLEHGFGSTVNKTISVIYAEYMGGRLEKLNQRKYIKMLTLTSEAFLEYSRGKKVKDSKVFEEMVSYYNMIES